MVTKAAEWEQLPVPPILKKTDGTNEYVEIKCYDSLNCMAFLQYNGTCGNRIIRTTDGGMNWTDVYLDTCVFGNFSIPFPCPIKAMAYPSENLLIAVGDSGFVLRTTDKGETWSHYNFDKGRTNYMMDMYNEKYGIMASGKYDYSNPGGKFFLTNNSGISWDIMISDTNFYHIYLESIQAINKDLFYALYWEPSDKSMRLLRVHGNWESWDTTFLCYNYRLHYMSFINEKLGFIGGELPIGASTYKKWIIKTEDAGYTWKTVLDSNMYAGPLFDLKFYDENFGFAASGWWTMVKTSNGGQTWEAERLTNDTAKLHNFTIFTSLSVPSKTNAYSICDGQYIYKFTRDWTDVSVLEPCERNKAYPYGFPNPTNDFIYLRNLEGDKVRLLSAMGELVKEVNLNGANGATIDVSDLPAGIYFMRCGSRVEKIIKW